MSSSFSRRQMLKAGIGAAGYWLAGQVPGRVLAAAPATRPAAGAGAPSLPVAIQRCESFEPQLVRAKLDAAFDLIGGIKQLVANKTVTIKINVTGGPGKLGGLPGYRTYHNHPNMLAALCASLHDAGATRIYVVESQYSAKTPEEVLTGGGWDVAAIKSAGAGTVFFEDTRNRGEFSDYSKLTVPWGGFLYPAFMVHPRYEKTDVFISLAKLKEHSSTGVTLAVKNLFGMPPTSLYGNEGANEKSLSNRLEVLHAGTRLPPAGVPQPMNEKVVQTGPAARTPRVTADCVGARPIDLAIIDGIETNRGGEGPWLRSVEPLAPKLLIVGRNPVCTDAIATAAMGYDPMAATGQAPFQGENHLTMLASVGVGEVDPKRIEVRGLALKDAVFPFARKKADEARSAAPDRPYEFGVRA